QLLKKLEEVETHQLDRSDAIEQINWLIEKRASLLKQIQQPYLEKERSRGKEIIRLNELIKDKMNRMYGIIKMDLKRVQKKREQNYSYINPYGKIKTIDGMYLDSKL